jgi:RNA polymerase sigma-70 factor (ECF subfamily)
MAWGDELTALTIDRGPALVGYAYLLTGNLESARDLVQEALVRTYGRPRSASDLAWVEAYVRRVILNVYIDGYRRDRAWGRVRHLFVTPDGGPPDTEHATRTADHVDVQAALQGLPPRERACVVLRFYDDLTVPALAARLGISEGAAKRYLSDGIRRLHGALGPIAEDEVADVQLITRSLR